MKGIVVEIKSNDVVVLSDDGVISKLKNNNYEIGQVIVMKNNKSRSKRFIAGAASFVATIAICTIGGFAYFTPTDYVSLDVNPSIEYSVNMFDRVLDIKAVNDDGEEILKSLYLDNHTIEEAVKLTLEELIEKGYLTDDEDGGVIVTTSNPDLEEATKLANELKAEIQSFINEQEDVIAEVEALAVGKERVEEARKLGVTPGKLNLVQKLQASTDGAINIKEWLNKPVKEINKTIKEYRYENKNKELIKEKEMNQERDREKNEAKEMIQTKIRTNQEDNDEELNKEQEQEMNQNNFNNNQKDDNDDDEDDSDEGKNDDNNNEIKPEKEMNKQSNGNKPVKD